MAIINTDQFSRKSTHQTDPAPGKPDQVLNNAGGYVFKIDSWQKLRRFLVLGAAGGTYYVQEKDLLKQNYDSVLECIRADGVRTVEEIVKVSSQGLAPKNDPAIFALALCAAHGNVETKAAVRNSISKVCRTGTHILHFSNYASTLRGWGRSLRSTIGAWYGSFTADELAYQVIKYQSRDGWSHRDALRLSHATAEDPREDAVLRWAVGGIEALSERTVARRIPSNKTASFVERNAVYANRRDSLPEIIDAYERAKTANESELVRLITSYNLPREAVPTEKLNSVQVWEALLYAGMPLTAMIRNLAKMTSIGLLKPLSAATSFVVERLKNQDYIRKSRVHPMALLIAGQVYGSGKGDKGSLTWVPVQAIAQALDEAFYLAFGNVRKTGKPLLIALDVSGSMFSKISGCPISCAEGAAALSLVHAAVEDNCHILGFSEKLVELGIGKGMRLCDALQRTRNVSFGSTDCSLPAQWALENKVEIGGIVIITDSETYYGAQHPFQALNAYRNAMVPDLRQVVVGMTATDFTIADPSDPLSLDVVGFDASAPDTVGSFIRGEF